MDNRFAFLYSAKAAGFAAITTFFASVGSLIDLMPANLPSAAGMIIGGFYTILFGSMRYRKGKLDLKSVELGNEKKQLEIDGINERRRASDRCFDAGDSQGSAGPFAVLEARARERQAKPSQSEGPTTQD